MADGTKIEWTDATWNVVNGCSVLSPGCTNCYAMRLAGTRLKHHPSRKGLTIDTKAGPVWNGDVRFNEKVLLDPIKCSRPRRIFVCAHGDLFHSNVPNEWIDQVFAVMAIALQHTFQVLTKRPERMRDYLRGGWQSRILQYLREWQPRPEGHGVELSTVNGSLRNVWLGVSVEDQTRANERIPILLFETPAAVRWISAEPLLGPLNLTCIDMDGDNEIDALNVRDWADEVNEWRGSSDTWEEDFADWYGQRPDQVSGPMHPTIDWVVTGGESGPSARTMRPDWVVSLHEQCKAAGVPFLFKQWGEYTVDQVGREDARSLTIPIGAVSYRKVGKKAAGRKLFGIEHNGYPA